jgi:hypothetical protein
MSKKHFESLARHIRTIADENSRTEAAMVVAAACREANSKFNMSKFLDACGVTK